MNDRARIQELADAAARVTPTPDGHPRAGEYVVWCDTPGSYTASGTIHDAAFLALAPRVAHLAAEILKDFDAPLETWAEVEVVGHRSYVGRVREDVIAGVRLVRVEALRADGTFEAFSYGHQAIFSITPRSEAEVRHAAVPRSYQSCDAFKPSGACPCACVHCGHDLPEHDAARAETKVNDASTLDTAEGRAMRTVRDEEKGDDMPW